MILYVCVYSIYSILHVYIYTKTNDGKHSLYQAMNTCRRPHFSKDTPLKTTSFSSVTTPENIKPT